MNNTRVTEHDGRFGKDKKSESSRSGVASGRSNSLRRCYRQNYLDQIQQYITLQQQHFCTRPHKKLKKVDKSFCNKLKFIIFVVKFNPKY